MSEFEEIECPLCKHSAYETLFNKGKFDLPLNFSLCKNCGFAYLNPRWTKERYHQFYTHEYDQYYRSDVLGNQTDDSKYSTVKQVVDRLERMGEFPSRAKRVLDIGSGMGWALQYLKKNKLPEAEMYAIESSEHCIKHLESFGATVIGNDVDVNWEEQHKSSFDLVIMRHVLEHFMDPVSVLAKVREVLSSDGLLYVAVPNADNPDTPLVDKFLRVVHTMYFTPLSLENAMNIAGIHPTSIVSMNDANPYEVFVVGKVGEKSNINVDGSEFARHAGFFQDLASKEDSISFRAQKFVKKRIKKYLG